jgi:primosomal protein N' (replication factor Y)
LRNSQIGDERLVEELGRTFPNTRIISSNAQHRILEIDDEPVIVIATPGTEPVLKNGYSAGVIINSQVTLQRATLNAEEESRRRWFAFATLLRAEAELFIDSEYGNRNIQALVRWDGLGASVRELQERAVLSLPPFAKTVEVKGTHEAVAQVVRDLPGEVLISAPKSLETGEMVALIRISPSTSNVALNEIFRRVRAQSARGSHVARLRVDPISF